MSPVRSAVDDYGMINAGDRVAVGVSGGKDSLVLLMALKRLSMFYPKPFEIVGLTLDMGMDGVDLSPINELASDNNIEYHIKKTEIYNIIFNERKEKNPCSLCAVMRRGILIEYAKSLGCNKIALGHHYDDAVETFMMNLIHEGRIGVFRPVTYMSRTDVTVIRPLIYVEEGKVRSCAIRNNLPVIHNPCPANGHTQRQKTKELIVKLDKDYKNIKKRLFGAIQRAGIDGWNIDKNDEKL